MFSLLTGVYDNYLAPTQLNVLVIGASKAGKTTLLERLKVTQTPQRPSKSPLSFQEVTTITPALHEAFVHGGAESPAKAFDAPSEATGSETDSTSAKFVPVLTPKPTPVVVIQKRRFKLSICPAPERYSRSAEDQEEYYVVESEPADDLPPDSTGEQQYNEEEGEMLLSLEGPTTPEAPQRVRCHSKEFHMEQLDLPSLPNPEPNDTRLASMESIPLEEDTKPLVLHLSLQQEHFEEFHVRPKAKMLPLSKIRATIGTNLGKIDMFGAKCHFFDVGGKLQDLWERYYDDCDAVIFCWKLGDDPEGPPKDDADDDDDEDALDIAEQQQILNKVRKAISDDIPFLIFGHVFGNVNVELVDKMYSTDLVLPHYHNNLTGMCCGSAKTGAGVQHAMEWLIPLAKRQQKERIAARKKWEQEKGL